MMAGEQRGSGKGTGEESPPQLPQIFPLLLRFTDSRTWCACLLISVAARDAVRALFSGLIPQGPRPEEGWTGAVWRCFLGDHLSMGMLLWAPYFEAVPRCSRICSIHTSIMNAEMETRTGLVHREDAGDSVHVGFSGSFCELESETLCF